MYSVYYLLFVLPHSVHSYPVRAGVSIYPVRWQIQASRTAPGACKDLPNRCWEGDSPLYDTCAAAGWELSCLSLCLACGNASHSAWFSSHVHAGFLFHLHSSCPLPCESHAGTVLHCLITVEWYLHSRIQVLEGERKLITLSKTFITIMSYFLVKSFLV